MSKSISKRATTASTPGLPEQVLAAVTAAADRKAEDIVVLDLRKADGFTDYFVICTGQNARQIKAIADAVEEALRRDHVKPAHVEGYGHAEWVLLDYFDFIVHVFGKETRTFYGLERLWGSATPVDVSSVLTRRPHRRGAADEGRRRGAAWSRSVGARRLPGLAPASLQRVLTRARDALDGLLAAVLAAPCVVCGHIAEQPTRGAACEACWTAIRFITPPVLRLAAASRCRRPARWPRWLATTPGASVAVTALPRAARRMPPLVDQPPARSAPTKARCATSCTR